jgi:hypothetical protein
MEKLGSAARDASAQTLKHEGPKFTAVDLSAYLADENIDLADAPAALSTSISSMVDPIAPSLSGA